MLYYNLQELIGNTPVLFYKTINDNKIYLKLEMFNPGGSIKDRITYQIINELIKNNKISKGSKIVEATSGNTGIGLALIGALNQLDVTIVMPQGSTIERINLIKAYGGKVILTNKNEGMKGAIIKAKELEKQGYYYLDQFNTPLNIETHKNYTAKEIINTFKNLDYLVCGIGTGGTITGLSETLKQKWSNLKSIGIEPFESSVITNGSVGIHNIPGIGAGFIPPLLNLNLIDEIITVDSISANKKAKELACEGLFLGISSAAAILGAEQLANKVKNKSILVIAPDGGQKYLSMEVFK